MSSTKFIIIGNGIVSLSIALGLRRADAEVEITIVGPNERPQSASLAAAAMLNSFAELEPDALANARDLAKFDASQKSARLWRSFIDEIEVPSECYKLGTVVLNNTASDRFDDGTFRAIRQFLEQFNEPYEQIESSDIRGYNPTDKARATQALFIPREGWVHPEKVLIGLENFLKRRRVSFINNKVDKINFLGERATSITLENQDIIEADFFVISAGSRTGDIFNRSEADRHILPIIHGVGCTIGLSNAEIETEYTIRTPNRGGACGIYHAQTGQGSFVIGASNLPTTHPEDGARLVSIANLMTGAMDQINQKHMKSILNKITLGYRPMTLDAYPIIGFFNKNTYILSGTKRDGYHMGPYFAKESAAQILGRPFENSFFKFCDPFRTPYTFGSVEDCAQKYSQQKLSALAQHGHAVGNTSAREDLMAFYHSKVVDFCQSQGISSGVHAEIVEPLLGGYLPAKYFLGEPK